MFDSPVGDELALVAVGQLTTMRPELVQHVIDAFDGHEDQFRNLVSEWLELRGGRDPVPCDGQGRTAVLLEHTPA